MKSIFTSTILSCLFLLTNNAFAAPLRVCLDKSGRLIAAQRCGRGQIPVNSSTLDTLGFRGSPGANGAPGPVGATGPTGPEGLPGTNAAGIFDAQGARVGSLLQGTCRGELNLPVSITSDSFPFDYFPVVIRVSDVNYVSCAGVGGFLPTGVVFLYESSDCTGQPYTSNLYTEGSLAKVAIIGTPSKTLYIRNPDWLAHPISFNSQRNAAGGSCIPWTLTSSDYVPVNPTVDLDSLFQQPFSLR